MIRAVIFDFDGVINDSGNQKAMEKIIAIVGSNGYNIPTDIEQRLKNNWGIHGAKFIEISFGLKPSIARNLYHQWEIEDETNPFPLVPHAGEIIERLRFKMRMRPCLLTSRNGQNLFRMLDHYNLVGLFWIIQSKDDWPFVKPDPHTFCNILSKLVMERISREECVYVGDTPVDFEAATKRGITCINVLTGIYNHADFLKIGQKKENIIRSIADLPAWLEKYGN